MKNFRIIASRESYMYVRADSERFGKQEIVFEGNTFNQCFDFIKRETGKDKLNLKSYLIYEPVTDREGRTFPWNMEVVN